MSCVVLVCLTCHYISQGKKSRMHPVEIFLDTQFGIQCFNLLIDVFCIENLFVLMHVSMSFFFFQARQEIAGRVQEFSYDLFQFVSCQHTHFRNSAVQGAHLLVSTMYINKHTFSAMLLSLFNSKYPKMMFQFF